MKRSRGFSIVELLIVIAVLGVAGAMAMASLQNYLKALRATESARSLSNLVAEARNRAIKQSTAMRVELDGNEVKLYDAGDTLVREISLPHRASAAPTTTVRFTGRGLPDHQYVFTVTTGSESRRVVVLPTGKVILP